MKSVSDLNTHWWYRFLKVLYGIAFLLVVVVSALITYNVSKSYLAPDWRITCEYGNRSTFNAFYDKDIPIGGYDPDKAVPADMDAQIKTACGITQADIQAAQNKANTEEVSEQNKCANGDPFACMVSYSATTYSIGWTQVRIATPGKAVAYTILDILIVLCLFELIRRIFYYIALGKLRPQK